MKRNFTISLLLSLLSFNAIAQFIGPGATVEGHTVEQVQQARLGTYVTVTGRIVAHQRDNYFTFHDSTDDVRVEIDTPVWQSRQITPETKVRLLGEIDRGRAGRYL